jgi:hypothetical protein
MDVVAGRRTGGRGSTRRRAPRAAAQARPIGRSASERIGLNMTIQAYASVELDDRFMLPLFHVSRLRTPCTLWNNRSRKKIGDCLDLYVPTKASCFWKCKFQINGNIRCGCEPPYHG